MQFQFIPNGNIGQDVNVSSPAEEVGRGGRRESREWATMAALGSRQDSTSTVHQRPYIEDSLLSIQSERLLSFRRNSWLHPRLVSAFRLRPSIIALDIKSQLDRTGPSSLGFLSNLSRTKLAKICLTTWIPTKK